MTTPETPPTLTPMLTQYLDIKRQYPDAIVFYRMGDFYEMFMEDAITAAPVLEVQLTSRDRNSPNPVPMCGVPHHSVTTYLQRMLKNGYKVALCEQIEDPATAKGLVKRAVVRVVTPSLIGDPELVSEETRNILLGLQELESGAIEATALDLLAGTLKTGSLDSSKALQDLCCELLPREFLVNRAVAQKGWLKDLSKFFASSVITVRDEYFIPARDASKNVTTSAIEAYLRETQKVESIPYLGEVQPLVESDSLKLDAITLSSLAVLPGGENLVTLVEVLDNTVTPMGRRMLKEWLTRPLSDVKRINGRHDTVEEILGDVPFAEKLRDTLSPIRDLERLASKTALGLAMPRDLVTIRSILSLLPTLKELLGKRKSPRLKGVAKEFDLLAKLTKKLDVALEDLPPATLRDGGIFKETFHAEIAELRTLSKDAKGTIAAMETREKARTGISTLKIKYSRVFGYTIEVTKSQLERVPQEYIRKQTIANGERYITQELKQFEEKAITAEQKLKTLEEALFIDLRNEVAKVAPSLLKNARLLAELDSLHSFARVARLRNYVRPEMHDDWDLDIVDGRHPVIETLLPHGQYVPNSITFQEQECRTWIITGPNMAGKSTIMRQVALIALMAHAGSFVPAASARLPVIDAIFTRIGSSDDLTRGRSTFMVEMTEVARILEKATTRSLILIDEIGRGTSTYDGLSLAWALVEYIHTKLLAKTLFATHFHEVTSLEALLPGLKNANVTVEKWKNEIVFLHKLAPGICNQSYGIEVAKLAGLPADVLSRAKTILGHLEGEAKRGERTRSRTLNLHEKQLVFFDEPTTSPAE